MPKRVHEIYSTDYFEGAAGGFGYTNYDADKQPMIPTFEQYLDLIEKQLPEKGKLLDVGAATGFFLTLARRRGWTVQGVEVSPHAAQMARDKGLDVRTGIIGTVEFEPQSFDVVTMWDVIEHMENPRLELDCIARLLKPSGILAINTPDAGSALAKIAGNHWHLVIPPEHLNLFTEASLRKALSQTGFDHLASLKIGKRFTTQYILHTLNHVVPGGFFAGLASKLRGTTVGEWNFAINLRDNILCLGRKM